MVMKQSFFIEEEQPCGRCRIIAQTTDRMEAEKKLATLEDERSKALMTTKGFSSEVMVHGYTLDRDEDRGYSCVTYRLLSVHEAIECFGLDIIENVTNQL